LASASFTLGEMIWMFSPILYMSLLLGFRKG
jgi:hypothetical protein